MNEEEAIGLLKEFRKTIGEYLFLGFSPSLDPFSDGEGSKKMSNALKDPQFEHLRDVIMDMEIKVLNILEECGFSRYITIPMYTYGDPRATVFQLVWRNYTGCRVSNEFFFERIDEAIKVLQKRIAGEMILLVPGSMVGYEAFTLIAEERQVILKSPELGMKNEEILQLVELSEVVVLDLTAPNPNSYFLAGYAQGIGRPLIYIAEEGTEIDFDSMECPVIYFETKHDLRRKVCERLDSIKREKEMVTDTRKTEPNILGYVVEDK